MVDIFSTDDTINLLQGKFLLMIGDSNTRNMYIDLVHLICNPRSISPPEMFVKNWANNTVRVGKECGDRIISGSKVKSGRDYYQEREFKKYNIHIRFHFVTKAYGNEMISTLNNIEKGILPTPNIVLMNSCLWDITRWGPMKEDVYKKDLTKLFSRITKLLPEDTLIIWYTTLPVAVEQTKGGLIIQQLKFVRYSLRFMIMEANKFVQQLCMAFGVNLLDLHYQMRYQIHRRAIDGLHWEHYATRFMVCSILTHISLCLNRPLPRNVYDESLHKMKEILQDSEPFPPLRELGLNEEMKQFISTLQESSVEAEKREARVKAKGKRRLIVF